MKKKLSNYIIAAFFFNVFAIMCVGGVCILMVKDMVANISNLEQKSTDVSWLYDVNNEVQEVVFLVHQSTVKMDSLNYALKVVEEVKLDISYYKSLEEDENFIDNTEELLLLEKVTDNLDWAVEIITIIQQQFLNNGQSSEEELQKIADVGHNIKNLTENINNVHFKVISTLVNESYSKMYFIMFLYLTSSLVGILGSCVGYVVLTRNTITPIINLASATERVASGDLGIRVGTDSATEIGILYESFNVMTEKLQEHEKRREEFNRELERQVMERTSELRDSEFSLREAQSQLVRMEKIATLGQIATTVNHEIKTPLNALSLNLQLLIKKITKSIVTEEKSKQGMLTLTEIINNEVSRINEIIEEFVKYARFPAPDMKPNEVNLVITELAEMISQNAQETDVVIELSLDENLGLLLLDKKKLIQVLLNLCMNALHAMPYGGMLKMISKKGDEHAIIQIADTGIGISKEDQKKIFDPFFTKKDGGLGFGLAIVQRVIEDHNGTIECYSELDKGTTFTVKLPINV